MNKKQLRNKAEQVIRSLPDGKLLDALIEIIGRPKTPDNNTVRIWLIDEVESRFDDFDKAMSDLFFTDKIESYDERLIHFVKNSIKV